MPQNAWVFASCVLDTVYRVGQLPTPGASVFASAVHQFLGGKGSNQAIAAARQGAPVQLVGCLGQDEAADLFLDAYRQAGIETTAVRQTDQAPTGSACIAVDDAGQNQIAVHTGANALLTPEDIPVELIKPDDWVLGQLEVPDDALLAAALRGRFLFNPAPARRCDPRLVAAAEVVTPNEAEVRALTAIDPVDEVQCRQAARELLRQGTKNVVITLGGRGAYWASDQGEATFPAPTVHAVDTTGAGDAFNGALLACLVQGLDVPESIPYAIGVASLSVTRPGAAASLPTRAETLDFLDQHGIHGPWSR